MKIQNLCLQGHTLKEVTLRTDNLSGITALSSAIEEQFPGGQWLIETSIVSLTEFIIRIKSNVSGLFYPLFIRKNKERMASLLKIITDQICVTKDDHRRGCTPQSMQPWPLPKVDPKWTIEAKILPLVTALNNLNAFCTQWSCQGHIFNVQKTPFVLFYSSNLKDIFALKELITQSPTNLDWILKGQSCQGEHIQWCITTEEENSIFANRKKNRDILLLARTIESNRHRFA
jgi:hypothetical protein